MSDSRDTADEGNSPAGIVVDKKSVKEYNLASLQVAGRFLSFPLPLAGAGRPATETAPRPDLFRVSAPGLAPKVAAPVLTVLTRFCRQHPERPALTESSATVTNILTETAPARPLSPA